MRKSAPPPGQPRECVQTQARRGESTERRPLDRGCCRAVGNPAAPCMHAHEPTPSYTDMMMHFPDHIYHFPDDSTWSIINGSSYDNIITTALSDM
jgi:hypothetical protein